MLDGALGQAAWQAGHELCLRAAAFWFGTILLSLLAAAASAPQSCWWVSWGLADSGVTGQRDATRGWCRRCPVVRFSGVERHQCLRNTDNPAGRKRCVVCFPASVRVLTAISPGAVLLGCWCEGQLWMRCFPFWGQVDSNVLSAWVLLTRLYRQAC